MASVVAVKEDVDVDVLDRLAHEIIGENPDALRISRLPGCRKMAQP